MNSFGIYLVLYFAFIISGAVDGKLISTVTYQDYNDNAGMEFVFTIPENYGNRFGTTIIISAKSENANVEVFFRGNPIETMLIPGGKSHSITLPKEVVLIAEEEDHLQDGVFVTSDEDITIQVYNDAHHRSMDGFLALPTESLGNEYIVMTYKPWIQSQIALIGVESQTRVTVTPSESFRTSLSIRPKGIPFMVSLSPLQVKQIICKDCDFTGTIIRSDKPIAVIAGNRCAFIPDTTIDSCDTLVEQLIPVNKWGKTFAVTPIPGRTSLIGNRYRVIAARYGTEVSIDTNSVHLRPGQHHDFVIPNNESTLVVANKPVLLAQFIAGFDADNITGDPSMTLVPAIEHSVVSANLATYNITHDQTIMSNYITISASCSEINNITFDGEGIANIQQPSIINLSGMCFMSMKISYGTHSVQSLSNQSSFCAILYGFAEYNSFAHPVALRLANTLCVTVSSAGDRMEHNCDEKVILVELPYSGADPTLPAVYDKCDYSECVSPAAVIGIAVACAVIAVCVEISIRYKCKNGGNEPTLSVREAEELKVERRVTRMENRMLFVPVDNK